jgi:hypothetical protein
MSEAKEVVCLRWLCGLLFVALIGVCVTACSTGQEVSEPSTAKRTLTAQARARMLLESDELPEAATQAFDAMFHVAQQELRDHGHGELALQLGGEWQRKRFDLAGGRLGDTGDHQPFSQWVAQWYAVLEAALGEPLMEATHLRDIWVLNFSIPVVFNREAVNGWCVDDLALHPSDKCIAEYRRHFVGTKYAGNDPFATAILHHGFAGVVTYWLIWAGCEGATWGGGWFVICTPLGDVGEYVMEKFFAPKISDRLYLRTNPL